MANHKSALKRIRQSAVRRLRNRYQYKTTRTMIKRLRNTTSKSEATVMMPKVFSLLDRLAKRNIIHKNKASNQKSKLARFVNKLG
jgi:small subunit ribosomal protein S20